MTGTARPPRRSTYRHGDLRNALLAAGVDLARAGGPAAVVLRETTRRAGVAPNAAYRHFADRKALLQAVSAAAMAQLAIAMEAELANLPETTSAETAHARLRSVGVGYLRFAQAEPGLFRAAFSVPDDLHGAASADSAGRSGKTPFQLLGIALDELVATGVLPAAKRQGAEFLAWSSVHGLAMLLIDGPLRELEPAQRRVVEAQLLDMVDLGLR
ncbi:TetR/AcrR family transcriptional regulator [Saxibacter everestensis]|uniref:TetR/AcrR family transcriptional regulator n=1 Tax=Saxibacter everestensis TaxID=2909229 RepID=A0ABY8QW00_9MICO|nr:TetR/AcrR family transcriptional regulator [Brevibacteriaceae bacterium ZFBP1038]